jgi:LuxR family transcriptional regulator, transcriptional regulator of spore coat protein
MIISPLILYRSGRVTMAAEQLSQRELDVMQAIVEHGTIDRAAEALSISPHTVDRHVDNVRKKSGLRYLPQMTAWVSSEGWLKRKT